MFIKSVYLNAFLWYNSFNLGLNIPLIPPQLNTFCLAIWQKQKTGFFLLLIKKCWPDFEVKLSSPLSRRCGWRARGQIVCGTWWWCTPAGDKTQRKTSCWESTSRAKTGKSKPLLCVSVWRSSFFQIGSKLTELLSWIDIDYHVLIGAQIAFSWLYIESTAVGRQENGWERGRMTCSEGSQVRFEPWRLLSSEELLLQEVMSKNSSVIFIFIQYRSVYVLAWEQRIECWVEACWKSQIGSAPHLRPDSLKALEKYIKLLLSLASTCH